MDGQWSALNETNHQEERTENSLAAPLQDNKPFGPTIDRNAEIDQTTNNGGILTDVRRKENTNQYASPSERHLLYNNQSSNTISDRCDLVPVQNLNERDPVLMVQQCIVGNGEQEYHEEAREKGTPASDSIATQSHRLRDLPGAHVYEASPVERDTPGVNESQAALASGIETATDDYGEQNAIVTQIAPMMQPDLDITDEAYAESTSTSFVTSITSEISRGILENERIYPQYGQYSYGMPVDEEEMDRMDLQHRKYQLVIGDKHFLAPICRFPQRILDLCTGTGIWALDVADMFPSAQVIGVDIAPIQPKWVAPNCDFEIDDVEAAWAFQKNNFDFIHLRDPLYVVRDWPKLLRQCYEHLKPGGWFEVACIYPVPICDDGTMPLDSAFKVVCDKFIEASRIFGTPADCPLRFAQYLQNAGFVDVAEHIFKIPSSPWPKDKRLKKIGALELTNVIAGASAFGLRAFEQAFGWSKEETELAMIGFRRDVKNRKYHHYCQYGKNSIPLHLERFQANQAKNFISKSIPEIIPVRQNADPLLSAYTPLQAGKVVSITTSSSIIVPSVPHLYKLAQYPIVLHVTLGNTADFSEISSIRQCGFAFVQSETLQEAQDIALTAHALASRTGKGVIHFFDPSNSAQDDPITAESQDLVKSLFEGSQPRAEHTEGVEETLYVNNGRTATVTDIGLPAHTQQQPQASAGNLTSRAPSSLFTNGTLDNSSATSSSRRDSGSESQPPSSAATTVETPVIRPMNSSDVFAFVSSIWATIRQMTGRNYSAIEYSGPPDAEAAIYVFGSTGIFVDVLDSDDVPADLLNIGIITTRLYRPWFGSSVLLDSIPSSVKKIAVLEQIRRKTTKWGPSFLDLLSSLTPNTGGKSDISLVQYRMGHIEPSTAIQALRGIFQNLTPVTSPRKHSRRRGHSQASFVPIQNLSIGKEAEPVANAIKVEQPKVENAYLKILDQLFGNRLYLANQTEAQHAGISSSIAASPEYGFGSLLARTEHRERFVRQVEDAAKSKEFITESPKQWLSRWALIASDPQKANQVAPEVIARLANDGSRLSTQLLDSKALFFKESQWLIGSDAWAYDLGNSGVHHVLASGANVNMLIIDSEPYSVRASTDANRRKKDIGLYAMNFGNAYVGSVAVYGSYTQVLQAMIEAENFNGPSIILAYLPYNKEDDSPLTVLQETKKAVDMGYWPLYRWDPSNERKGESTFMLDSEKIKKELEEFLRRDNQLTQIMNRHPQFAANLSESYGSEVRKLQKRKAKDAYEQMLEGLYGAPLTILFASDNGNAESLAKRLGNRGRARGLKTMVFAMDDYPLEDLSSEENVVFISSTAGQGEFPQNGRAFWEAIKNAADLDLSNTHYSIFALGDSHYWPRKEDKIFYNKPGKDLDARVEFLGGKTLTAIGLGDDQDPDTYQTGYQEWEPRLWQALNVANVEGLPEEPPPLTNEDIKTQSNYLRGTIAEGLEDPSTGAISASDQQLTKFHGTYMQDDRDLRDERKAQGLEPAYSFMIRCRLPGGIATPSQWLQMDTIASSQGNETMKLTTRQTFQFHGVIKSKLRPAMRAINKALMTTIAACGDVNRNVMCSSLPSMSEYHHEVHAISQKISDHLLPSTTAYHEIWLKDDVTGEKTQVAGDAVQDFEPMYGSTYLPRKFKITIAIPPHNDTDVYAHDVGLIAIRSEETGKLAGFNILAGGGMGVTHNNKKTYPRTGYMMGYVSADKAHLVCEKIMLVQRDNGDRKNRKHARLKYTMDDMGNEVFKAKVQELLTPLDIKFAEPRPFHFKSNIDTFGWQRDEKGMNHFTFFIENGRVEDTADFPMRTGIRELAKVHKGEFRLTGNQHLILSNVSDSAKPQLQELMKTYKLDNTSFSGLRLSSSACVAFPTCGLAMAESERYLPKFITDLEHCLEQNGLAQDSIVFRMTGCPNGCARPWVAEAAFVGKAYGAYNIYLGGGYHGQRLNKLYRSSVMEEEMLEIMKGLLGRYAKERNKGEHFGDWTIRAGVINETTEGKYFHENTAELESDGE